MSDKLSAKDIFARLLRSLEPYVNDIVLVGGWVHALYLADANASAPGRPAGYPVHTDDIDITIPLTLHRGDRPSLIELAEGAGFRPNLSLLFENDGRLPDLYHPLKEGGVVDLDILVRAESANDEIWIEGQPGLVAHGYPDLHLLTENTRVIEVGPEVHSLLDPPIRLRVPKPAAYVFQKGLASERRQESSKAAKDLVYVFEILRHPGLGDETRRDFPLLANAYSEEYARLKIYLHTLQPTTAIVLDAVDQLIEANRVSGNRQEIAALLVGQIRRLIGEADRKLESRSIV